MSTKCFINVTPNMDTRQCYSAHNEAFISNLKIRLTRLRPKRHSFLSYGSTEHYYSTV